MRPAPIPASTSSIPATNGPPNSAEIAENEPAVATTDCARSSPLSSGATVMPTTDPSAISGASGPSAAPNASVPTAATAMPGPLRSGVGAMLSPPSGGWPPSPGSSVRAATTKHAPTTGRPTTRYHGGADAPR